MAELLKPGAGLLFIKVGTHAQEPLDKIIERKTKEIEEAGYSFWGYGGNTCHPQTMVQPFAKGYQRMGQTVRVFMEPMKSSHFAEPVRADEYSIDGLEWSEIPAAINVLGSRYALAITGLRAAKLELPLDQTVVAIGNSKGRRGDKYVQGRVDKACLEVAGDPAPLTNEPGVKRPIAQIGLIAELTPPFAVYLRNK